MKDDPNVRSERAYFYIRRQHLKRLYAELSDQLRGNPKARTPKNRQLLNAMGNALRLDAGIKGGVPKSPAPRCPCDEMTAYRAKVRYHHCTKDGPVLTNRDLKGMARRAAERSGES